MEIQKYNRLKAASKQVQSVVIFDSAEREQARTQFKIGLAEKGWTGTWLSDQMGHSISTVSRWMTNKVQPSVEQFYEIARHLDVDVKELLVPSK
jgi:transcriptional regulator with XRE-family HTH domain